MSKNFGLIVCVILLILSTSVQSTQIQQPDKSQILPRSPKLDIDYGKIPLYFVPNQGQVDDNALFYADASKYTLWITREGLIFDSYRTLTPSKKSDRDVSRLMFLGANPYPDVIPEEPSDYTVSYFRGTDRSNWHTGIETSQAVLYQALYPQIDLRVYGIEQEIEYDFIVKPGGEVNDIGFVYRDVHETKLDQEGNLTIQTAFGELSHTRPVAYQIIQGKRIEVKASFKRTAENSYGFEVENYDETQDLIIDPLVIVYSTYLGGKGGEGGTYLAVDMTGAAYLACWINSKNFPMKNPLYPKFSGQVDVCIAKLNPEGNSLVYSTYLGGSDRDGPLDIAIDITGAAYIVGIARAGFPTVNPLFEYQGMGDPFVVKVHPSGTSLIYSTYLGGSDWEQARDVAADADGNAYITGITWSQDFPIKKAYQKKNAGRSDIFLAKINPTGSILRFSTYLGGTGEEAGIGIKVDEQGSIYITGETTSKDFPKKKAFQKKLLGEKDAFITKFHKRGKRLIYSTYFGGSKDEVCRDIDVDMWGNIYVIGSTNSPDFPLKNPLYSTHAGDFDILLAKFKPKGKKLLYSTFLGGDKVDNGHKVIVDKDNTIFIRGYTESKKFPTKDAFFKKYKGKGDVALAQISEDGQSLIFSTFYGGSKWDRGGGLALDYMGGIYLAGGTESPDIPVKNAFQRNRKGETDMYLTKFKKE